MTGTLQIDVVVSVLEEILSVLIQQILVALFWEVLGLVSGDLLVLVAFGLLVAGVVGSLLPAVPGAPLSIGGVLLYWWTTGQPGPLLLGVLVLVGVVTLLVDWFGGAVAARASGTSTLVSAAAGLVGLVGMVVAGPIGLVLGIAGTVFAATFYRERDAATGVKRAVYATAGVLASAVVQALLTASILLSVLLVHLF